MARNSKKSPSYFSPRVFLLNKPKGISSTTLLSKFKKKMPKGVGKVGHFGTLDPFAEGLLLVGTNGAMRMSQYLQIDAPKTYLATGVLGHTTITGDNTGEIIKSKELNDKLWQNDLDDINNSLKKEFLGEYLQVPPFYSATKHEGKRLYELARQGIYHEKDPVRRHIHSLEVKSFSTSSVFFQATVSTGTYIRTLFEDIARHFDQLGHLIALERTSIGTIALSSTNTMGLEEIEKIISQDFESWPCLLIEDVFPEFGQVNCDDNLTEKLLNGMSVPKSSLYTGRTEAQSESKCFLCNDNIGLFGFAHTSDDQIVPKIIFKRDNF